MSGIWGHADNYKKGDNLSQMSHVNVWVLADFMLLWFWQKKNMEKKQDRPQEWTVKGM